MPAYLVIEFIFKFLPFFYVVVVIVGGFFLSLFSFFSLYFILFFFVSFFLCISIFLLCVSIKIYALAQIHYYVLVPIETKNYLKILKKEREREKGIRKIIKKGITYKEEILKSVMNDEKKRE